MIPKNRKPTHSGEILLEEFLKPTSMSQVELVRKMRIPIQRINTLINGKRDMTAETAVLLSRALKTSSEFWMNLQFVCGFGSDIPNVQNKVEAYASVNIRSAKQNATLVGVFLFC